jgi:hypothetical protein
MMWAAGELSVGYYGWRNGDLTEITFRRRLKHQPVALAQRRHRRADVLLLENPQPRGLAQAVAAFPGLYAEMFGDPWPQANASNRSSPPA